MKNLKNWPKSSLASIPLIFALWGCSKPPTVHSSVAMGEEIVRSMAVGRIDLETLRAETKVVVSRGILKTVSFHASLLIRKPSDLFIQTSGFGFPATLVSISKKSATVYIPPKNRLFEGNANDGLHFVLPTGLSTQDWITLLLGQVPEIKVVKDVSQEGEVWKILAEAGNHSDLIEFHVDEHSGWLKSYEYLDKKIKVIFGAPLSTPIGEYPSSIRFENEKTKIVVSFEKIETNLQLSDDLFQIEHSKTEIPDPIPNKIEGEE